MEPRYKDPLSLHNGDPNIERLHPVMGDGLLVYTHSPLKKREGNWAELTIAGKISAPVPLSFLKWRVVYLHLRERTKKNGFRR